MGEDLINRKIRDLDSLRVAVLRVNNDKTLALRLTKSIIGVFYVMVIF
jgi:hypothetical protein